jgi:hypothetical protein
MCRLKVKRFWLVQSFNEIMTIFPMERFLLSHTPAIDRFVIEGAVMLRA